MPLLLMAYHDATIVVDFGTATTFDYITKAGEYLGGAIVPGVGISLDALFHKTAKLYRVEMAKPPHVVGRNTVHAIQSGIFYGYTALVDGMVERIQKEHKTKARVIATGGFAQLIAKESTSIEEEDEFLTLEGLRILYEKSMKAISTQLSAVSFEKITVKKRKTTVAFPTDLLPSSTVLFFWLIADG
jgi:type III pantothenate kinase